MIFIKLRSLISTLLYPIFIVVMSIIEILFNLIFNNRSLDDYMVRLWGRLSNAFFGVEVKVFGIENYPKDGCLILFNHTSFFDIFALAQVLPGLRFGAKEELFRIPFFGVVMRRVGMLEIARERKEEVFKVYERAQKRFALGEKFALAPEGTRQEIEKLGTFKSGPFIFAMNAEVNLIPVVIRGAAAILPKGKWFPNWNCWRSVVEVHILPSVSTVGYTRQNKSELMDKVWVQMDKTLQGVN